MMRKMIMTVALCAAVLVQFAQPAFAQDERKVGIVMAYPSDFGVLWQVSPRIAVRPDVSFSWTEQTLATDLPYGLGRYETKFSSNSMSVGVSVLLTVARWERLRAYVVPRFAYTHLSGRSETGTDGAIIGSIVGGVVGDVLYEPVESGDTSGHSQEVSGSFGVEYSMGERFGIYGETGIAYVSATNPSSLSDNDSQLRAMSNRSSVGIIFRF